MIEGIRNLQSLRKLGDSEQEIQRTVRIEKMRFYEPINEFLPPLEKKWYDSMIEKGYESTMKGDLIQYEVFSDYKEGPNIGLTTSMSPKEVLQSLKIYTKTKEYNPGSDDMTSEKFESLVRSDPYEYSKLGASLLDIDLKYCHHFLNALLDPIKLSSKISWAEVLDLCFQLLNKSNEPFSGKREFYFGANPIAHFLCTALGGKTVLVPITLRDKVWSIVECLVNLTKNKDTLSYLIGEKDIRTDYHFSMINSALFCSVECLLFYNSWFNSSIHDPNVRSILPEVKQILDDLVGHSNPTIQVRCAISSNLSYLISLDIEWTRGYLKKIIPSLAENKVSYYAAWECYLIRNAVRSNTFAPLYPYYLRRIRNLKNDPNDYGKSQATEALVVHVLHAYLLDANDSDILFEEFMNNSTNEMLSTCLRKLAFLLLKYKEDKKAAINLNRVRRIWELEKFWDCEDFLDLFVNSPFDKKTSISLLHKFLTGLKSTFIAKVKPFSIRRSISELKKYAITEPMLTLECTLQLSRLAGERNCTYLINTQVLENLLELKGNTDPEIMAKLEEIKEFFGHRGFNEFRNI